MSVAEAQAAGSSPLTRGALTLSADRPSDCGLIPAHAGSTACAMARTATARAHPRSRGEHVVARVTPAGELGSSPLTRGARVHNVRAKLRNGLIPAHAGST
ncbi:hypothetical protein HMPREF3227_01354 [Corynebacterium sp. CMW7794]|nr:hypothetical protein HMPREF3227_01354 [Corynebacterium sp. CMW7794]